MPKLDWEKIRNEKAMDAQGAEYVPKEIFGGGKKSGAPYDRFCQFCLKRIDYREFEQHLQDHHASKVGAVKILSGEAQKARDELQKARQKRQVSKSKKRRMARLGTVMRKSATKVRNGVTNVPKKLTATIAELIKGRRHKE